MKLSENTLYRLRAIQNRSVVDLIKFVSIDIYNRIGFVRNLSRKEAFLRIYEVTLTQNLIYELIRFTKENNLNLIGVYESTKESTNGSDILLCIKLSRGFIKIPVQAKILNSYKNNRNGNYKEFWHKNKYGLQFELLEKHAEKTGSLIALYLFYNYTENSSFIDENERECYYGCSYTTTNNIKNKYKTDDKIEFGGIHPEFGLPFYKLFIDNNGGRRNIIGGNSPSGKLNDIIDFYKRNGIEINESDIEKIHFYTEEEIYTDENNWKNLANENQENAALKVEKEESFDFNPKYKIVLIGKPTIPDSSLYNGNSVYTSPTVNTEIEHGHEMTV